MSHSKKAQYHNPNSQPRHRRPSTSSSSFEDAVCSDKLFEASEGTSLRIFRAPRPSFWDKKKPRFFLANIPEKKPELSAAEFKARASNSKMLNWIQLLTTPTADTNGTTLILHFDNQRYVFGNIAEGTQRAMVQRGFGLSKANNFFLTGVVNWQNTGGLLGMVLTLADVLGSQQEHEKENLKSKKSKSKQAPGLEMGSLKERLSIHGGKNLSHFIATSRRFIFRKGIPLEPFEIRDDPRATNNESSEPDWKDTNIKVWHMPIVSANRPCTSSQKRTREDMSESNEKETEERQLIDSVVRNMFNSNWAMDALVETTLHQVQLPAKLFVRDETGHIQVYEGPLPENGREVPDIPVLVREPWPATKVRNLPRTEPSCQSMCYIVKNHNRRGKFNLEAATRLNVVKTDFRYLTLGQTVTSRDGTEVTPQMVLDDDVLGEGFAVLDVPDSSYLEPLLNRTEWSNGEIMKGIRVMFWLLGPNVADDHRLQDFTKKHVTIRHIVCSGDTAPNMLALESVAIQAYKLHCIDPDRFHLPIYSNERSLCDRSTSSVPDTFETGRTGKRIQFAPQFLHEDLQIVPFPDVRKLAEKDLSHPALVGVMKLAKQAKSKITNPKFLAKIDLVEVDIPNRDAEIITLGTGSALPSKYRNVSATLVRVPGFGNYLFDAGENTLGQMRRVFGKELSAILRDLKVIWISHLHADHHLGTAGVIKAWHDETRRSKPSAKMNIASHQHMLDWLREYADVEDFGYDRVTTTSFSTYDGPDKICKPRFFASDEIEMYGLERIDACFVSHCHGALATVFTWPSGLKIAYSGDCRPDNGFVKIGQGSTVLIHESTFDDELKGDAKAKKHSTMSEAIAVGRRMRARRILLTHFSQRYQKVPLMEENFELGSDAEGSDSEKAKKDEVILVAFDYMRVKVGDFRKAQAFLPAIHKLFEDFGGPRADD